MLLLQWVGVFKEEGRLLSVFSRAIICFFPFCKSFQPENCRDAFFSVAFNNQSLSSVSCIQLIFPPLISDPHHFTSVCHLPSENQSSSGTVNISSSTFHINLLMFVDVVKSVLLN